MHSNVPNNISKLVCGKSRIGRYSQTMQPDFCFFTARPNMDVRGLVALV
jgi:hypothetical protein